MANNNSKQRRLDEIWQCYKDGKNFQRQTGLESTLPLCVDFYEGRQWGKVSNDAKTKLLPRPVLNQTEMIVNSKISNITSGNLKVVFMSNQHKDLAEKLTNFNAQIENEMKFNAICEETVEQGAVEGSSFTHFYYDAEAVGKRGEYKGGVRAEIIDPLNILVHNPRETDIQKQKWIMIVSRCELDAVKAMCQFKDQKALIAPDEESRKADEVEQNSSNLVTVLTIYTRKNGEVYFEKATKTALLCKPTPINPALIKDESETSKIDNAEVALPDNYKNNSYKMTLYPVSVYQYKRKKNCLYGRGEVEPIIQNNRIINFNTAMMAKAVEDLGFGTIVAKDGALEKGAKLTNNSTKMLIDKYKGGNGFYRLDKQPFSPQTYQLNKDIMETTRSVNNATEVMTGEIMGSNQSGTSIAYLQQQAQKSIDKLTKRYREYRRQCAEILVQFYVTFYEGKEFENTMSIDEANEILSQIPEQDRAMLPKKANEPVPFMDVFNGKDFANYDFDVRIEVGAGTQYSEIMSVSILDNLLSANRITLRTYFEAYPDNLLPNKKDLIRDLDEQEKGQIAQLTEQLQTAQANNEKLAMAVEKLTEIANNIAPTINENKSLKTLLAELQNEYQTKINMINQASAMAQQQAQQPMNTYKGAMNNGEEMS